MKKALNALVLLTLLILSACHVLNFSEPVPGMSQEALIAAAGKPVTTYQDDKTNLWEYSSFWGQQTHMARFDEKGRLTSWEQVLTSQNFAKVKIGEATKRQILLRFGQPAERSYFSRMRQEVWSYRFKEEDVWDSLMNLHFDEAGIVRKMEVMRDPLFDPSERNH
jgi:hypothetical protein